MGRESECQAPFSQATSDPCCCIVLRLSMFCFADLAFFGLAYCYYLVDCVYFGSSNVIGDKFSFERVYDIDFEIIFSRRLGVLLGSAFCFGVCKDIWEDSLRLTELAVVVRCIFALICGYEFSEYC